MKTGKALVGANAEFKLRWTFVFTLKEAKEILV